MRPVLVVAALAFVAVLVAAVAAPFLWPDMTLALWAVLHLVALALAIAFAALHREERAPVACEACGRTLDAALDFCGACGATFATGKARDSRAFRA